MAPPLTDDMKLQFDAAEALLAEAKKDFKKSAPAFTKAATELKKAVDGKQAAEAIAIYQDQLDKALELVNDNVSATTGVMNYAKAMRDSGAAAAAPKRVAELLTSIAPIRKQLLDFLKQHRELSSRSEKARSEAEGSVEEIEADLAAARDRVKDVLEQVGGSPIESAKKLSAAIDKAFETKKQADVTKNRMSLIDLNGKKRLVESAKKEVEELLKRIPKDQKELRSDAQEQLDKITSALLDFPKVDEMMRKQVARGQVAVEKKEAEPPPKLNAAQLKKIAEIIGIAASDHAKLGKIIDKHAHQKWPAEIAKACSLKESDVKAKMNSVNRLEFVKPFYLIDI
jgi:hypothetical protein